MQDNNKDILIDKSWDAMHLILDKEMPQKKKRRFFFWWLFGGLLLISSYFVFDQMSKQSNVVIANKENIIAQSESFSNDVLMTELGADDIQSNETNNSESNTDRELRNSNERKFIEDASVEKTEILKTQNQKINKSEINKSPNERVIISESSSEVKTQVIPVIDAKEKINNLNADSLTKNKSKKNVPDSEVVNLNVNVEQNTHFSETEKQELVEGKENLIDDSFSRNVEEPIKDRLLLSLPFLTSEESISALNFDRDIVISPSSDKSPDYWYGQMGSNLGWAPGVNLYGFDFNIAFGRSIRDRIDLGLALGVGSFRYSESTNSESDINAAGRVLISESEAGNILNSSFKNASFIDLGLQSSLRFSNRFRINAELGYMYLFTSMFNSVNNPNQFTMTNDTASSPESIDVDVEFEGGEKADFIYELEQKWFPYATLGTSIGLNQKLGINFSYKKVFGQLFESSSNPLSMNQIQVGIKYRFLDSSRKP